jgi:integrating conjugative element protein (TIGR03749 family)
MTLLMIFLRALSVFFSISLALYSKLACAESLEIPTPQLPLSAAQIEKLNHLLHASKQNYQFSSDSKEIPAEHLVWNQTPIAVKLPIGIERMVRFSEPVQVGYDKTTLTDEKIRIQNNSGTLYLLAKQRFAVERIQVKLAKGNIILLDISAEKGASATPLEIVASEEKSMTPAVSASSTESSLSSFAENNAASIQPARITPIALTRFAAQQLYAPQRLLIQSDTIYRIPMHTKKTINLVLDGSVIAMPLASWRGGDQFITAVLLRNTLPQPLTVHPRDLCGHWQTATFFPENQLAPRGEMKDRTTVFLVSNRPFSDSLNAGL